MGARSPGGRVLNDVATESTGRRWRWFATALAGLVPICFAVAPLREHFEWAGVAVVPALALLAVAKSPRRAPWAVVAVTWAAIYSEDAVRGSATAALLVLWVGAWAVVLGAVELPPWAGRAPRATATAWFLALIPIGVFSHRVNHLSERQHVGLGVAVALGLIVAERRPRWSVPVLVALAAAMVPVVGRANGYRFAVGVVVIVGATAAVWARSFPRIWADARGEPPDPDRLAAVGAAVGPARLVVIAASVLLVVQDGFLVPTVLAAVGLGLALAVAVAAPLRAPAAAIGGLVERPVVAAVDRVRHADALVRATHTVAHLPGRIARHATAAGRWLATPTARPADDAARSPSRRPRGPGGRLFALAREYQFPLVTWAVFAYVMTRIQLLAAVLWSGAGLARFSFAPSVLDTAGRIGWGTGDNLQVAVRGYRHQDYLEAVFPAFALLLRWLARFYGDADRAQGPLAAACGLATVVTFWAWMRSVGLERRHRRLALVLLLVYPYSFMLAGTAYSDVLLLPLILGAFTLVERRHPVLAGVVGAFATFTRPNSLPLIPALILLELVRSGVLTVDTPRHVAAAAERTLGGRARGAVDLARRLRVHRHRIRPWQAGVLLSVAGVGSYSAWLVGHADDPLYFLNVQEHYGHRSTWKIGTWLKVELINQPSAFIHDWGTAVNHGIALVMFVVVACLIPVVWRRLGAAYGVFAVLLFLLAWVGSIGFAPGGRYLLPVMPFVVVIAAEWLAERRRLLVPLVAVSSALSIAAAVGFAKSGLWLEW